MYTLFVNKNLFQCYALSMMKRITCSLVFPFWATVAKTWRYSLFFPFHYPWLEITSKQTALGCSCKQLVGMSMLLV